MKFTNAPKLDRKSGRVGVLGIPLSKQISRPRARRTHGKTAKTERTRLTSPPGRNRRPPDRAASPPPTMHRAQRPSCQPRRAGESRRRPGPAQSAPAGQYPGPGSLRPACSKRAQAKTACQATEDACTFQHREQGSNGENPAHQRPENKNAEREADDPCTPGHQVGVGATEGRVRGPANGADTILRRRRPGPRCAGVAAE